MILCLLHTYNSAFVWEIFFHPGNPDINPFYDCVRKKRDSLRK